MKKIILILLFFVTVVSCKEKTQEIEKTEIKPKNQTQPKTDLVKENSETIDEIKFMKVDMENFPPGLNLQQIFSGIPADFSRKSMCVKSSRLMVAFSFFASTISRSGFPSSISVCLRSLFLFKVLAAVSAAVSKA